VKKILMPHIIPFVILYILTHVSFSLASQGILTFKPLEQKRVIRAAKTVTRAKYPNADVVDIDLHKWVTYHNDGTYNEWYECYSKILTEKGKRSLKTVSSSFTIPYNTTKFTLVEVIKKDGTIDHVVIDKNSRVMIEQSQMQSNIFNPNNKVLRVSIPKLDLGDTIHYIIFDDFAKVRVPDTWSDYVVFESTNPIIRSEYTVIAPKEKPLQRIVLKDEIPGNVIHTKQTRKNFIIYKWIARDIPRVFPEPKMPPLYTQTQRLLVSTIKNWGQISRWYWNLSKPNIDKTTPEMLKKVNELTLGIDDPHEKIKAVFQWVSHEIRYLGLTLEKNSPGYEPHPVNMTFDTRAGVCRDKAALLVAMLRLAGFNAYPVLIMNGPKKDYEVPQPFFNHAISCVRERNGSYLLMDSTDESTKQLLPSYLNNQSYLVATPRGETLRTSPIQSAEQNMIFIETNAGLDAKGNVKAKSVLRFEGINDNAYRGFFSRLSADERLEYFEKIAKKISPSARLTSYTISPANMLDTARQLEAEFSFEVRDLLISGKSIVMLPLLRVGNTAGMVNFQIVNMGLKQRKYPYFTNYACGVNETLKLTLGNLAGKIISLPKSRIVETKETSWARNLSLKGKTLLFKNVFKMKLPEYTPEEYLAVKKMLKKIEYANRKMLIFSIPKKQKIEKEEWYTSCHSDAVILDEVDEYCIKDANNWTETIQLKLKVLTYAGKKQNSDIHIYFNPVWEDVEIQKAIVTSPSGDVKAIQEKEINKMDAGWVGDAPRYPAAKTLVVSLPGVEVGSTIEYSIMRKKRNRPFFSINGAYFYHDFIEQDIAGMGAHPFFSINGVFRYYYPIVKKTVRLNIPDNLRLNILKADQGIGLEQTGKVRSEEVIRKKVKHRAGRIVYEFIASDVKPVKHEEFMPPWYSFNPTVLVSAGNWGTYSEDVRHALLKAASSQQETMDKAHKLIDGICGKKNKIISIRNYVAKNIHRINLPISHMPLEQITPSDKTLADGYGNSADSAVLLYALLYTAGFHPEFVLSSWGPPVKTLQRSLKEYPDPEWFHGVLVRVKLDNAYVYLNDTDQYAMLGSTPSDGYPGLFLNSGKIETIRIAATRLKDRNDVAYSIRLFENGDAVIIKTRKVFGMDFANFRKQFTEMPPEKRLRHHQTLVTSVSRAAIATGKYITDYDSYPGIEEFSVAVKKFATPQGKYLYLKLPGLISHIAGVTRPKRENPMYRDWFSRQHVFVEVILPDSLESFQAIPPESLLLPIKKSGEIIMKTRTLLAAAPASGPHGTPYLCVQQDINLMPIVIMPDEYLKVAEANMMLGRSKMRMLLLKMKKAKAYKTPEKQYITQVERKALNCEAVSN